MFDSLVEEHDVRFPDLVGRQPQHADAAVVRLVPLQLVVVPHLNKIFLAHRKNIFVRIKCNRKSVQKSGKVLKIISFEMHAAKYLTVTSKFNCIKLVEFDKRREPKMLVKVSAKLDMTFFHCPVTDCQAELESFGGKFAIIPAQCGLLK